MALVVYTGVNNLTNFPIPNDKSPSDGIGCSNYVGLSNQGQRYFEEHSNFNSTKFADSRTAQQHIVSNDDPSCHLSRHFFVTSHISELRNHDILL